MSLMLSERIIVETHKDTYIRFVGIRRRRLYLGGRMRNLDYVKNNKEKVDDS